MSSSFIAAVSGISIDIMHIDYEIQYTSHIIYQHTKGLKNIYPTDCKIQRLELNPGHHHSFYKYR